jgi:signal transduction histidine kinase
MHRVRGIALAAMAVAIAAAGTALVHSWIAPSVSLLFFPAVVVPAMYGGYAAAAVATVLSTLCLAYFFIPPENSFNIGIDDGIRLGVFVAVSFATAWLGSKRRQAEEENRHSIRELRATVHTLEEIADWPLVEPRDFSSAVRQALQYAARILSAEVAVAVWASDDEPWLFVATSAPGGAVQKFRPDAFEPLVANALHSLTFLTPDVAAAAPVTVNDRSMPEWHGVAAPAAAIIPALAGRVLSSPFHSEHLTGRVFFVGVPDATWRTFPAAELIAREVSASLEQLYAAQQARQIAVREDRVQVSRDLHDGVLQALTGIRLELQSIADEASGSSGIQARLSAIERALALEQRELRLFINDLKPAAPAASDRALKARLEDMCARVAAEWRTPIFLEVRPDSLALSRAIEEDIRLMVHEAISNALKHGAPSRVDVVVSVDDGHIDVTVADDGQGFPFRGSVDHETLSELNLGPRTLRERVTALSGRLSVESSDRGSRVRVHIPVQTQRR